MKEIKQIQIFMNKLLIFVSVIVLMITSCYQENHYKSDFIKVKDLFPDSLLVHFPTEVNKSYNFINIFPSKCREIGRCGSLLIISDASDVIKVIEGKGNPLKINKSCLFFPNKLEGPELNLNNPNFDLIPLPDFNNIIKNCKFCEEIRQLNIDNLVFFFIDSENGIFLREEYLPKRDDKIKKWSHGFSRGIAISYEYDYILYWLELW